MSYPNREVYAEPPLALVAAEVRHAYAPRLQRAQERDAIIIALDAIFPVVQPAQSVVLTMGPTGAQGQTENRTLLTNVDRTMSVTFGPNSIAFEATRYEEFPDFAATFRRVCDAVTGAGVRPIVERIGLRYIDEVRVPQAIAGPLDWDGWIHSSLVDQVSVGGDFPARHSEGLVQYALGAGRVLNFRFAAINGAPVVSGVLRRRTEHAPGWFFVLDVDAFELFQEDPFELESGMVIETLSELHDPAGEVFQRALTEKTRSLFRTGGSD